MISRVECGKKLDEIFLNSFLLRMIHHATRFDPCVLGVIRIRVIFEIPESEKALPFMDVTKW